jgi:hypothetical protein
MKYFTPERHLRLGNLDSEAEFLATLQEWEDANTDYLAHLESIRAKLPPELLRLYGEVHLHDAHVLSAYQQDEPEWVLAQEHGLGGVGGGLGGVVAGPVPSQQFVITLQPDVDARRLVVLTYSVTQEPLVRTVLPPDRCSTCALWTYDELDLDAPEEGRPTFRHDVLLSNGEELTIHFRSVKVSRPLRLLSAVPPRAVQAASA